MKWQHMATEHRYLFKITAQYHTAPMCLKGCLSTNAIKLSWRGKKVAESVRLRDGKRIFLLLPFMWSSNSPFFLRPEEEIVTWRGAAVSLKWSWVVLLSGIIAPCDSHTALWPFISWRGGVCGATEGSKQNVRPRLKQHISASDRCRPQHLWEEHFNGLSSEAARVVVVTDSCSLSAHSLIWTRGWMETFHRLQSCQ